MILPTLKLLKGKLKGKIWLYGVKIVILYVCVNRVKVNM